jgi:hypothetical protein
LKKTSTLVDLCFLIWHVLNIFVQFLEVIMLRLISPHHRGKLGPTWRKAFSILASGPLVLFLFHSSAFAQTFFCPNTPRAIAAGDFNGDTKLDVAVVRQERFPDFTTRKVFIYPGNGSGGLGSPSEIQLNFQPSSVVAADFIPGGNFEIVVANVTPTLVGTLSTLAVGDFNGDGKLDVAVADTDPASGSGRVRVFLQISFPNFSLSFTDTSVLWGPADIAVGDFNGDGYLDFVVAKRLNDSFRASPGEVTIFLGNGTGGFTRQPDIQSGGSGPQSIVVGDFNGDGNLDLAVLHFNSSDVSVLFGDGDGNFVLSANSPIPLPVGVEVPPFLPRGASLVAIDFDVDGNLDLVAATHGGHSTNNRVFVLFGDGQGDFETALEFDPGCPPRSIVAGDFNGDGLPDIAASFFCGADVKILLNPLAPPDTTPPVVTCSASPNVLWPPNHKMVEVNVTVTVSDAESGPAGFELVSVTSNEPDEGLGDGDFPNDIQGFVVGTADTSGFLRAERSGLGTGRTYMLTYEGSDQAENTAQCTATVTVPHDQRK